MTEKFGKNPIIFDPEIRGQMHENKKDVKQAEDDIKELLEDIRFNTEWLKLQKSHLDTAESLKDDPDIGHMAAEEIEETQKHIEEVKAAIENSKALLAEFVLDKAKFEAYGDELKELEQEVSDLIRSGLGGLSKKN